MTEDAKGKLTDYTGLVILALVAPIYFLFLYLGNEDIGLTATLSLGMIMLAVRIRWDLRKHAWFWAVITVVLVLHVPLMLYVQWPHRWVPGAAIKLVGLVDLLLILGVVRMVERALPKRLLNERPPR